MSFSHNDFIWAYTVYKGFLVIFLLFNEASASNLEDFNIWFKVSPSTTILCWLSFEHWYQVKLYTIFLLNGCVPD